MLAWAPERGHLRHSHHTPAEFSFSQWDVSTRTRLFSPKDGNYNTYLTRRLSVLFSELGLSDRWKDTSVRKAHQFVATCQWSSRGWKIQRLQASGQVSKVVEVEILLLKIKC
jgi:hypothetical protein